jgi:thiosulfate/3-mercaptopyruvate sulfurtransferase
MTAQQLVLCLLLLAPGGARAEGYPRPDLLLEPAELAKPEVAKKFRILDARPRRLYKDLHIPGAVWVDHDTWSQAFAAGRNYREWATRIGELGIGPETPVVVYGGPLNEAARIWWILHYWGLKDARILNGGWQGWLAAGNTVSRRTEHPDSVAWKAPPRQAKELLATKEGILKDLKNGAFQIVDARSEGEHCGTVRAAKRNGSIPGALNLEWTELLDRKTGRFKSAPELRQLFARAGIRLDRPTITYCQSGGRAAVMAFALELVGADDVRNYYRSWAEWGNAEDTPVERPKAKTKTK